MKRPHFICPILLLKSNEITWKNKEVIIKKRSTFHEMTYFKFPNKYLISKLHYNKFMFLEELYFENYRLNL